jgi:transglutaminase-like putative cysteine protease
MRYQRAHSGDCVTIAHSEEPLGDHYRARGELRMRLRAGCNLNLRTDAETPLIAMLRPRSGEAQWVVSESYELDPFTPVTEYVDSFGNLCQRLVAPKGAFRLRVDVEVETADQIRVAPMAPYTPIGELPSDALQFLLQSRYCPSDRMEEQAQQIAGHVTPGYAQVEAIRRFIHERLEYKYGVSTGSTDALQTLSDGAGVCRDFSHVGIALCRALKIPARMVVGWLHELDPMDMHAWFEAFVGGRWYTLTPPKQSRAEGASRSRTVVTPPMSR